MFARVRKLFLLWIVLVVAACSDPDSTPEAQIRSYIERGIEAAEQRSVDDLVEMMHPNYLDSQGNRPQQIEKILRLYFLRHKNIHLFSKIDSIELINDNQATVKMHVAMAGSVIADVDALAALRAQIYRFELELVKQSEWQLQHARWARASAADLR